LKIFFDIFKVVNFHLVENGLVFDQLRREILSKEIRSHCTTQYLVVIDLPEL